MNNYINHVIPIGIVFSQIGYIDGDHIIKMRNKIMELIELYKDCQCEKAPIFFEMMDLKISTNLEFYLDDELINNLYNELKNLHHLRVPHDVNVLRNFNTTKIKAVKPRKTQPKYEKPIPPDPKTFAPSLRFMCEPEFIKEARNLYEMTNWINPRYHEFNWFKTRFIDNFEDNWPLIAKADRAIGGKFFEVIRMIVDDYKNLDNYYWMSIIISMQNGNPTRTIEACEFSLSKKNDTHKKYEDPSEIEINKYY